ncbi:hypothetical protein HYC85_003897 [Camellia sinensis]|uniref:Uncharacterized protein n=1 Tax=Camellia sinensis TaxID=4442 RepID=A0A7J7HUY0_CAMSI|nr:hypothetical protein HYC85_003897 [Camellia sinensis]
MPYLIVTWSRPIACSTSQTCGHDKNSHGRDFQTEEKLPMVLSQIKRLPMTIKPLKDIKQSK